MNFGQSLYDKGISAHYSNTDVPNPSDFERHCHPVYELIYVIGGKGKYIAESNEYDLLPNTVVLLHPFEYHYVRLESSHPYERIVINFEKSAVQNFPFIEPLLSSTEGSHGKYFPSENISKDLTAAFSVLQNSFCDNDEYSPALMKITLSQILFLLSRQEPVKVDHLSKRQIFEVIEYLNRHWNEPISLDSLAKQFFLSKSYLCRAFHKQTGVSIITYLNAKRIAFAQEMLAGGELATEVCYRAGFLDYSVFYRTYKKVTGQAPGRSRK